MLVLSVVLCSTPDRAALLAEHSAGGEGGGSGCHLAGSYACDVLPPVRLAAGHATGLFLWGALAPRGGLGLCHLNFLMGFVRLAFSEPGGQALEWRSNFIMDMTKTDVAMRW